MERLLYSPSPTSLKFNPNRSLLLPRLGRIDSAPKLNFPSQSRSRVRLFDSICCKNENPSSSSNSCLSSLIPLSNLVSSSDSRAGSPKPHFLEHFGDKEKVKRSIFLLSALAMILIQPIFAPAASASFQAAAKTGGGAVGRRLIQSELLSSAWTGFFAGCLHTLSGPDHLAALAPLSIGCNRIESAAVGALWGCGHDAGQVIFGLLFLLLKDKLQIEILRTWGTIVVGLTLFIIGVMGIKEASEVRTPCVALGSGNHDISIYETLEKPMVGGKEMKKKKKMGFATFATGVVHGLQPDALMIVLPALAMPSRIAGAAFLVMFLFGTVVSMGSYTAFIGSFSEALKDRVPRITEKLTWAASFVAIALGLAIIISQFLGYSLY